MEVKLNHCIAGTNLESQSTGKAKPLIPRVEMGLYVQLNGNCYNNKYRLKI